MRDFISSVLGSYTPADDLSSLAGADWEYIFTGILFCLVVWATLRILGGIICKMR